MSLFYDDQVIALKTRILELTRDNERLREANYDLLQTQGRLLGRLTEAGRQSTEAWQQRLAKARKRIRKLEGERAKLIGQLALAKGQRSSAAYMRDLVADIEKAATAASRAGGGFI